jgi:diguanylate cyclase (GGDEF)-like protein
MLEEKGHDVFAFRDGAEALQCIQRDETIDLLITSLEVPTISGLELCWEARLLAEDSRALYVMAMSSTYDGPTLGKALDSGADDFIMKPPDRQQLDARLRAAERLLSAQRKLIAWANRDPLTNLLNRRAFMDRAAAAVKRALSAKRSAVALILDIDHFKRVNDTFGHDVGDTVICQVADLVGRISPISGRIGGEEYAVLVENASDSAVYAMAESIRHDVAGAKFETSLGLMNVTVSIGFAAIIPGDTMGPLLKRADLALYAAKNGGRNRVIDFGRLGEVVFAA